MRKSNDNSPRKEGEMKNKTRGMRRGFTLFEFVLVVVLAAVVIGGIYAAYNKQSLGTNAEKNQKVIASVIGAYERVRSYNSNSYPAGSNTFVNVPKVYLELGASKGTADIATWNHDCTAGSSETLTITTGAYDSTELRDLIMQRLASEYAPWVFSANGTNKIDIVRTAVPCK